MKSRSKKITAAAGMIVFIAGLSLLFWFKSSTRKVLDDSELLQVIVNAEPGMKRILSEESVEIVRSNGVAKVTIGRISPEKCQIPSCDNPDRIGPVWFGTSATAVLKIDEKTGDVLDWLEGGE